MQNWNCVKVDSERMNSRCSGESIRGMRHLNSPIIGPNFKTIFKVYNNVIIWSNVTPCQKVFRDAISISLGRFTAEAVDFDCRDFLVHDISPNAKISNIIFEMKRKLDALLFRLIKQIPRYQVAHHVQSNAWKSQESLFSIRIFRQNVNIV